MNIIGKAMNDGWDINPDASIRDNAAGAMDFIEYDLENIAYSSECEITEDQQGQHLSWDDGRGYYYHSDGDFYTIENIRGFAPGTRLDVQTVFDSLGNCVQLYIVIK